MPGSPDQFFAYIAYDINLFEPGSIANVTASIIGNVFGFKPLKALRLEDMRIPTAYVKTFARPLRPASSWSASAWTSSAAPCWVRRSNPSWACQAKNYGRVVYEALKGGLDFTKDDENINSQAFMHWRDRFLNCMEAVNRAQAATGEIKGHYLNVTAGTMEDMYERAEFAKELGSVVVMIDLVIGYTAIQSMSKWARKNDMLLHLHRAGHSTYTRQKNHGISFRVICKWMRLAGVDHIMPARWSASSKAIRTRCRVSTMCCARTPIRSTCSGASSSSRIGPDFPGSCRSLPVEFMPDRCINCCTTWARMSCCSSVAAPSVTRWNPGGRTGQPGGARGMVLARNEGKDIWNEGPAILADAAKHCAPLKAALDTWGEITFNYASTDTLDFVPTPTAA